MTKLARILPLALLLAAFLPRTLSADAAPATRPAPFSIQVIDDMSARGVPLVDLRTVSGVHFVTDSAGFAAIDDPALLGRKVFFHITSHGYEFPADGFGMHGRAIELTPGGSETLKIKRLNIAERMYRLTGEGIYRDSVLLGKTTPIQEPLLNAQVTGQDSVQSTIYKGKIRWFWGDTNRQGYPLGHFGTSGATTRLPPGAPTPESGIDLTYFTDKNGFSRPMLEKDGSHPIWIDGLFNLHDAEGGEHLFCTASYMKSLETCVARKLVLFDDKEEIFKPIGEIPVDAPLRPNGQAFEVKRDGKQYIYFARPQADVRVLATVESVKDLSQYEGFTCLETGEKEIGPATKIARQADGKIDWAWRKDTRALEFPDVAKLVKLGKLKAEENWLRTVDVATQEAIQLHAGSVRWNAFRKKWVMIAVQFGGKSSFLGEVWYSEADAPEGPWPSAVKVVTHNKYSFYNPVHHDFLDQGGGRYIYFQGTYADTFSGQPVPTPRYDYNQVMYRLDLADTRLWVVSPK